jgi:hypothetical protein
MIGAMAIPFAHTREPGSSNWGRPMPPAPALTTEFELQVTQRQLTQRCIPPRLICLLGAGQNRNRVYIPEWLFAEWVAPSFLASTTPGGGFEKIIGFATGGF